MPTKIIIAAFSANRVLGREGKLPWHIPTDYEQYLEFVQGQTVIMGRKTYEIFAADLNSQHDLVISRGYPAGEDYTVFNSLTSALAYAETLPNSIFIAGGASIYAQCLEQDLADEMYLSHVKGEFEGDAFFPEFDLKDWEIVKQESHPKFEFIQYRRIRTAFPDSK